jgi:hypothetical protein
MARISLETARAAKRTAWRRFRKLGNVAGIGITSVRGEYALKVNLNEPFDPGVAVPDEIDGVPLRIEVIGRVRARRTRT